MAKEIHEQPEVIGRTLAHYIDMGSGTVRLPFDLPFDFAKISRLSISACGTAFLAGSVAKYWFERFARLPIEIDVASEFRYREAPLTKGDVTMVISQSGETADTLASLRYAKEQGNHVLAVVNVPTSTIARKAMSSPRLWPGRKSASPPQRRSPANWRFSLASPLLLAAPAACSAKRKRRCWCSS